MCDKRNEDVRKVMKENGLFQWQVAEQIGISEFTFTRWLRSTLSDKRKELILNAIAKLASR